MPGWAPCRAIGYSHPYRWCIVAWRRVRLHPCHCGRLWAKVPSSLCRHSEPRRRPLPAGTRVLVQRPVAKPEHNGKRARAVIRRAHRPVCGCAGRREGAVAQGRVRGEDGVRGGGMRVGGGEQRVRAALPPSTKGTQRTQRRSVRAVALRSDAASRLGRPGLPRERCERARTSVLATTCRSAGAVRSGRPRAGAERQGSEARAQGGEERRRRPERPTWSSIQYDTAQCADQGAASTPHACADGRAYRSAEIRHASVLRRCGGGALCRK